MSVPGLRTIDIHGGLAMLGALVLFSGCEKPRALGDANQILIGTSAQVYQSLADDLEEALEPRTFTVRDERVFDIAHVDPAEPGWANVRVLRQVLLIGSAEDPAVTEALQQLRGEIPSAPTVVQVRNVWAQNQLVTVALLPAGSQPSAALPLLAQIGDVYLRQYEDYARARMFVTGADDALTDSLRKNAGFALVLPRVYRYSEVEPGVLEFRNDQPDPSRLIRNITVDSRRTGEIEFSSESAVAWREQLAARITVPPQVTESLQEWHQLQIDGRTALQVQGIWSNPPGGWPAAGPFIARLVDCGARLFLIDAWLYAPGSAKYEYMYQLNTILDSFECA